MSSSLANPPSTKNIMVSDSKPGMETGFLFPNPSPTLVASDSSPDDENNSSLIPSPTPADDVAPNCQTSVKTTYSSFYPPMGTAYYGHPHPYHGYCQPTPLMNDGVSGLGQRSYYPPPPHYDIPACKAPSDRKRRGICCARIAVIIISFVIFTYILHFFVDLIIHPKLPVVSLTSAMVSSFSVNSTSRTISSDFTLTFSFHNPNKHMGIAYSDVSTEIVYGFETIAITVQSGFSQETMADMSVVSRAREVDEPISAITVLGSEHDLVNGGLVDFQVNLDGLINFSRIKWSTRALLVSCPSVKIQFSDGLLREGKMVGAPISCSVHS